MMNTTFFDPYWVIIRCISVYLVAEFLFGYGSIFSSFLTIRLLLSNNLWFVEDGRYKCAEALK
jgi:hypothetical protein